MTTHIKILTVIITLLLSLHTIANIITVKQDGTGDYTIIQDAVVTAANSDTVLIWPGTYYENVDFIGKGITLASLMLTTGEESYKYSTIIDGNNTGSCVKILRISTDSFIVGLTLQHGSGTFYGFPEFHDGGGILIVESSCSVVNCIIKNNLVDAGGGGITCAHDSYLFLSGTSIFNNQAHNVGGGLAFYDDTNVIFDSINRCSIYNNYSGRGCDIYKASANNTKLFLDTCTVMLPDTYFIISVENSGYPVYDITFNILNKVITPIDADLYVNPQTGDNTNSGLTPAEPLKTIAHAYSSIYVDSLVKNTIHLADGIYSDSANNEKFPLNIRPFINIIGESRDNTILDGMYKSILIKGNNEVSNYEFRNMTMYRGGRVDSISVTSSSSNGFAFLYAQNDNIVFDSILFKNGLGYTYMGNFHLEGSNNVQITNCEFRDNIGAKAVRMGADIGDTATFTNCIFKNNIADYNQDEQDGGSMSIFSDQTPTIVQGCLFTGNNNFNVITIGAFWDHTDYFINCTFTGNIHHYNGRSIIIADADLNMYNCIVYDEGVTEPIELFWSETLDTITMSIYNSLIENGEESIWVRPGLATLHYDETNIEGDPQFYGGAEYPYNLSDLSPCIDAGTLDLPDWIELPEFDLAGNPRIVGETIDMGAYEWNPTVGVNEYQPIKKEKERLLSVAPNPYATSTTISASFPVKTHVKLEIYNNNGLRVKALMDEKTLPGTAHIVWLGDDDNNHALPTGIYHVVMFVDDMEVESVKVIKR